MTLRQTIAGESGYQLRIRSLSQSYLLIISCISNEARMRGDRHARLVPSPRQFLSEIP